MPLQEEDNMRSYTNRSGEFITVDEEHLIKAVDIKLELQELSPSRRTSWPKHKLMMEASDFFDSDTTETYRCMIKDYQSSVNRLSSAQSFADSVADSKLDAIKGAVGQMYLEKQGIMKIRRELNKVKREISKPLMIAEEVRDVLLDEGDFSVPPFAYEPEGFFSHTKNKAIIVITDWHIGATVHSMKGNFYNAEIAQKRIDKHLQKCLEYCDLFNINDVTLACIGDMVEHVSMRNVNQSFEAEFPLAKQITVATKMITAFIVNLSEFVNVDFFCIAGNHDRFQGNKADMIDTDNTMYVIAESIKTVLGVMNLPRVKFLDVDEYFNYEHTIEMNNKRIKFVHGDLERKTDPQKLEKHVSADEAFYDAIIMGHYHTFEDIERNYGKREIRVGSPMGRNSFSRKFKGNSDAGQAIIIVTEEDIIPIRIDLQEYE